jgi:hypothetical protein
LFVSLGGWQSEDQLRERKIVSRIEERSLVAAAKCASVGMTT